MNINTDQLEALLRLQEQQAGALRRQAGQSGQGFESLLAQQLNAGQEAQVSSGQPLVPGSAQSGLVSQMLLQAASPGQELEPDAAVLQAAFEQASGTLELWDGYARAIGSAGEGGSLKEAWEMLEGIENQVARLRQDTSSVRGQNAGFDSLLNDLEVLTATEKFKFNRGDYI